MDRLLRPDPFNVDPNSPSASKEWTHWKIRFQKFIGAIADITEDNKLSVLTNLVSTDVFHHITDAQLISTLLSLPLKRFTILKIMSSLLDIS